MSAHPEHAKLPRQQGCDGIPGRGWAAMGWHGLELRQSQARSQLWLSLLRGFSVVQPGNGSKRIPRRASPCKDTQPRLSEVLPLGQTLPGSPSPGPSRQHSLWIRAISLRDWAPQSPPQPPLAFHPSMAVVPALARKREGTQPLSAAACPNFTSSF